MYPPISVHFRGELDADVLGCRAGRHGAMTPAELGRNHGRSEQTASSIIGMLAEAEGHDRFRREGRVSADLSNLCGKAAC